MSYIILSALIILLLLTVIFAYFTITQRNFNKIYLGLRNEIRSSIKPSFLKISLETKNLIELAIEIWRLQRKVEKISGNISEDQHKAILSSLAKVERFLGKNDIEVIDYTGKKYNDGLNVEVLSVDEDESQKEPIVKETIEPMISCKGQVISKAKVIIIRKKG